MLSNKNKYTWEEKKLEVAVESAQGKRQVAVALILVQVAGHEAMQKRHQAFQTQIARQRLFSQRPANR
jgi:hypothetical protein